MINQRLDPQSKYKLLNMMDPRPILRIDQQKISFERAKLEQFLTLDDQKDFTGLHDDLSMFLIFDDFFD
jgi:hypothetical protein